MKYEPLLKGAGNNSTTTSIHDGKLPVSLSPILGYGCAIVILMVFFEKTESARFVLSNGMVDLCARLFFRWFSYLYIFYSSLNSLEICEINVF